MIVNIISLHSGEYFQNITGRNDNNILDDDTIRIVIDDKHNIKK